MPSRDNIIDNVEHYSARELLDFINGGILTFDELCAETEGYLPVDVRKELEDLLYSSGEPEPRPEPESVDFGFSSPPAPEVPDAADDWDLTDKTSEEALKWFIETHPDHPMIPEANRLRNEIFLNTWTTRDIGTLKEEVADIMTNKLVLDKSSKIIETVMEYIDKRYISVPEFLNLLVEDNNFVNAFVVKELMGKGYFTFRDLLDRGFNERFIRQLIKGGEPDNFSLPEQIQSIEKVGTEIYFWGIPSSGKTCALGGILSVANSGTVATNMSPDNECQGYGYMTRLAGLFQEDGTVGVLPPGTPVHAIYEMGFNLEDKEGKVHPIICIDLAGELVRCMYKNDANEPLSDEEKETLNTVTNLLISNRSTNRKMHFFVLEYGGEDRLYEGLGQAAYLNAALTFIESTKIFEKETDGIFLLFTKIDKTGLRGRELVDHLVEYTEKHYSNFYNGLVSICKHAEINGGVVERLPFTLGTVCFQNYCMFDSKASQRVVQKILDRSKGFKRGKFQKIINNFKK